MASVSFLLNEDVPEFLEPETENLDGSRDKSAEEIDDSYNTIHTTDFGPDPANFILEAYCEKLRFKEEEGTVDIRRLNFSSLSSFAPTASHQTIRRAIRIASWRDLGQLKSKTSPESDEDEVIRLPDPSSLFTSVTDLLATKVKVIDLACPLLNQVLQGGLRRGVLTEVTGESSSGKTQFCLHAAAVTSLRGSAVVYLQTEGSFPLARLQQIVRARVGDPSQFSAAMDNVLIKRIQNFTQLQSVLEKELEVVIKEKKVALVIVDSVAAVLRGDKDIETVSERTGIIHGIGSRLQHLSSCYNFGVLVVNQVSGAIDHPGFTYGREIIPSLGPMWTNYINTRLFLTKTDFTVGKSQVLELNNDASLRSLEIDFSSFLAEDFFNFIVTPSGIMGIRITE